MILKKIIFTFVTLIFLSCEMDVLIPEIPYNKIDDYLKESKLLNNNHKIIINGLYLITEGKSDFGDTAVVKWSGNTLSIFVKKEQTYFILEGGEKNDEILFAGYWRYSLSEELGFINLTIDKITSAKILTGETPTIIEIIGNYEIEKKSKKLFLTRIEKLKEDDFYIIAHRGGGRNIDRLPYSENSLEIIKFAEKLGANSIEIDIQLTKDKVPILFHDKNLSKRLVNQDYFIGKVSEYDYKILSKFVTLKNNEKIPTLDEALYESLYNTNLRAIWLDIKSPEAVDLIIPIIINYGEKALALGKKFEIFLGIPDHEVLDAFLNNPLKDKITALCELDTKYLEDSGSAIWAPRWTLGLQNETIDILHTKGIKVFTWTLDENAFIQKFIKKSKFDGILTNYPFLVAYEYYVN